MTISADSASSAPATAATAGSTSPTSSVLKESDMRRPARYFVRAAFVAGLLVPLAAAACLWDSDTIKMERSRFPGTLELITGKFLRHSPEFYEWRIRDRLKRL